MMNHTRPQPRPGPDCAAVAPLVAQVVAQKHLHPEDASILRAHVETCDYCRSELESYRRLDEALARHFAPPSRNPLSPDEIDAIIRQNNRPRSASPTRTAQLASAPSQRPPAPYLEPPRRGGFRLISTFSALAAVLLVAVIGLAIFISHAYSPGTGTHPTPAASPTATLPPVSEVPYVPGGKDILSSIYMTSTDEGWAVGNIHVNAGVADTLILHYIDGQWKQVMGAPDNAQLHASTTRLSQVVMVSATEGWAVGDFWTEDRQTAFGLILHYAGGRWSVQQTIANASLMGLSMTSASDGWAVGGSAPDAQSFPNQSLLLHYDGHSWTPVQAPGQLLLSVSMTSATDGWIIGSTDGTRQLGDLLLRYNGSVWAETPLPPGLGDISQVSPISASDVWAVGVAGAPGGARNAEARFGSLALLAFAHYDGKTWTTVQTPITGQDANITSLFMDASNDGWAVGNVPVGQVGEKMVYLHYTGGKWTQVQENGPGIGDYTLFMLSASEGWAVGDNGSILHYHNGAWTVVIGG